MGKLRQLQDFTIKEYYEYQEMLSGDEPDIFGIFELFGESAIDMPFDTFEKKWKEIQEMQVVNKRASKYYKINGMKYKAQLNHLKVSAGQFIDFQSYMKNLKVEEILSVFLIPMKKSMFSYTELKYNDGYDVLEVQKDILNHMTIGEAVGLSDFFLESSMKLLKTMKESLEKKEFKMKKEKWKQLEQDLLE